MNDSDEHFIVTMVLDDIDASIQKGVKDSDSHLTAVHNDTDASV